MPLVHSELMKSARISWDADCGENTWQTGLFVEPSSFFVQDTMKLRFENQLYLPPFVEFADMSFM